MPSASPGITCQQVKQELKATLQPLLGGLLFCTLKTAGGGKYLPPAPGNSQALHQAILRPPPEY